MLLKRGMRVLFEGDSITDAGRDREDKYSLAGYVKFCADVLSESGVESYNRGISGNRTLELLARIEDSLREVKPDAVSILIGINDTWRRYDSNDATSVKAFEKNYRMILVRVREYTDRILLVEPFLLPVDPEKASFREDLDPKIHVVRKLAREFGTDFVPMDGLFAELAVKNGGDLYSPDGVHPNEEGAKAMAAEWLKRVSVAD